MIKYLVNLNLILLLVCSFTSEITAGEQPELPPYQIVVPDKSIPEQFHALIGVWRAKYDNGPHVLMAIYQIRAEGDKYIISSVAAYGDYSTKRGNYKGAQFPPSDFELYYSSGNEPAFKAAREDGGTSVYILKKPDLITCMRSYLGQPADTADFKKE